MPSHRTFRITRGEPSFRWIWPLRTTAPQRQALLRLIAVSVEERLPLAPVLSAWAEDERGVQRRRVRRLAQLIKDGMPLSDAVEQCRGALRDEDILAIRFGAQSGALTPAIRDALQEQQSREGSGESPFRRALAYFAAAAVVAGLIVTFLMFNVTPAFQAIFDDFDLDLSPMLETSIAMADLAINFWWTFALVALAVAWMMFTVRGRRVRNAIAGRVLGPYRQLQSADLLQKLSIASQSGRPIAGAISTLARYHFDPALRSKLLFVRNETEQGADLWQSMAAAGLLAPAEAKALEKADCLGNRAWTLRQLATSKRRRTERRINRWSALIWPVGVLLLGAFVLFQAMAYFSSLVEIVVSLSS